MKPSLGRKLSFDYREEAVHFFIENDDLSQLKEVLRTKPMSDVNYDHPGYGTPLHLAAMNGNLPAIELLLASGADPLYISTGELKMPPIAVAAYYGQRGVAKRLWGEGTPEQHVRDPKGFRTPLVAAAVRGETTIVQDVLDWWDSWPQSLKDQALLWAARRWRDGVAALLLQRLSYDQRILQEALEYAVNHKYLLRDDPRVDSSEASDYVAQKQLIALLVDAGADPNAYIGNEPLLCQASRVRDLTEALGTLLEKGAFVEGANADGESPLHIASRHVAKSAGRWLGSDEVVNEAAIAILLRYRADVLHFDNFGESPLHRAAHNFDLRLFELYLSSQPESAREKLLFSANKYRETLLHFAAAGCQIDIVEFLIGRGLSVSTRSIHGWSPLMCALVPRQWRPKSTTAALEIGRLLLKHGAIVTDATDEGLTPLHGVALFPDEDITGDVEMLAKDMLSRDADPAAFASLPRPSRYDTDSPFTIPWGYRFHEAKMGTAPEKWSMRTGYMPLHCAAERGGVGAINAMIACGFGSSALTADGMSATEIAQASKFLKRDPSLFARVLESLQKGKEMTLES